MLSKTVHSFKPIPNRLRKYRRANGLSQREAARLLGLAHASSLSRWEQGHCLPSPLNLFRLAAIYRTLVDSLYIDVLRTIRQEVLGDEAVSLHRNNHDR
jgi:transcriptional regulator with XRE-family HTH domain